MDPVAVKAWLDIAYYALGFVVLLAALPAVVALLYYLVKNLKE